ncbi:MULTISPECIES: hypothetical protein [unclassified Methylophaga]|uniref:hypothetical protein n=1 Tax=unclassified Methylophaga TaxID=2629249 RepID=UPI000C8E3ABD|nr:MULTISPECIES: hypothetical protein [unclassified Methylophaga]MBN45859.1 hypothetical protein [Methylophaga sp.]|tara:strand:- start:59948 stop:60139 length:192 start_codon:yes stop_codon:yes gene_type:complete
MKKKATITGIIAILAAAQTTAYAANTEQSSNQKKPAIQSELIKSQDVVIYGICPPPLTPNFCN